MTEPQSPETDQTHTDTPDGAPEAVSDAHSPGNEPETFSREFVDRLRAEAASARVRAGQADELAAELLRVTIESATASILRNPADLPSGDYLNPTTGLPDPELIRVAAELVAEERPYLAKVRGDAGQGARPAPDEPPSLGTMLRTAAS